VFFKRKSEVDIITANQKFLNNCVELFNERMSFITDEVKSMENDINDITAMIGILDYFIKKFAEVKQGLIEQQKKNQDTVNTYKSLTRSLEGGEVDGRTD
jgi:hypothetical protein